MKRKLFATTLATVVAGMLLVVLESAHADIQVELQERQQLVAEVERRLADVEARKQAMVAGRERSMLCAACHGADGNAKKSEYPNLAAQNPAYTIEQMAKFKDGRRKNFVMETLVRGFTLEDQINLALYFSAQQLKPVAAVNPQLAVRGKGKFKEVCAMCHGENGRGEQGYARLAGQQIDYVTLNLKRYRENARHASDFDESKRTDARMEQVTQFLSDEEIEGLAHFIAQLQ